MWWVQNGLTGLWDPIGNECGHGRGSRKLRRARSGGRLDRLPPATPAVLVLEDTPRTPQRMRTPLRPVGTGASHRRRSRNLPDLIECIRPVGRCRRACAARRVSGYAKRLRYHADGTAGLEESGNGNGERRNRASFGNGGDGATRDEAIREIRTAMALHIKSLR